MGPEEVRGMQDEGQNRSCVGDGRDEITEHSRGRPSKRPAGKLWHNERSGRGEKV